MSLYNKSKYLRNRTSKKRVLLSRVYYIDNGLGISKSIDDMLASENLTITHFADKEHCCIQLYNQKCNLLITEAETDQSDCINFLYEIKKFHPLLPIILIVNNNNLPFVTAAIKIGVFDIIKTPVDEHIFISMVRFALRQKDQAMTNGNPVQSLSMREREVLKLIGDGRHNKEIAHNLHISVRTVEFHRSRIMNKLNITTFADLIKMAIITGLTSLNNDAVSASIPQTISTATPSIIEIDIANSGKKSKIL